MSQFIGDWNVWWADPVAAAVSQGTLSIAAQSDGNLAGTFGSGGPVERTFSGLLGQDVIGDGEILAGQFAGEPGTQAQGFTFVLERPNFIAGAFGTVRYGIAAPLVLFGIRKNI
jgi:hypothetical protein